MALKPRERLYAGVLGLILLGLAGRWLLQTLLSGPLAERQTRLDALAQKIDKQQQILRRARQASEKLATWNGQSLPANTEVARSLYQNWLLEIVNRAGFQTPNVDSGEAINVRGIYRRVPFSVRGRASLAELTKFLYDFYRADHLHQIQRVNFSPVANTPYLDLALSIEALILPGAVREDQLGGERSNRLASDGLAEYQFIAQRNLFGDGGAGQIDPADLTFLTAILDVDGRPEAWFTVRTDGTVLKLHEGQAFEVGDFRGVVAQIADLDLVVESDDERWLMSLGENLSQATALPPEF